jgi:hypothetical protein
MTERNVTSEPAAVNLGNISKGAVLEGFAHELALVLTNIADLRTPATAKRSITLKVDFVPQVDRVKVDTTFSCTTKLAGMESCAGQMFIAKQQGGGFVALDEDPRQMVLWPAPKPLEGNTIEFKAAGAAAKYDA